MRVSVTDAKAQLTELVKRAEDGEEVVLTRHGQPVATIMPVQPVIDREERKRAIREAAARAKAGAVHATPGASAARSADFLYGDDGLPQ